MSSSRFGHFKVEELEVLRDALSERAHLEDEELRETAEAAEELLVELEGALRAKGGK